MNSIKVDREQVELDYPTIYKEFVENLKTSNSLSRKSNVEEKSKWFYTWGSFVPVAKTDEAKVLRDLKSRESLTMLYPERLEFELSKIRVNVTMEVGKFIRGDRARKSLPVPQSISDIVAETTKVTMLMEQKEVDNQEVIDSIPEIDENIIPKSQIDILMGMINGGGNVEEELEEFTIDSILDKINDDGIESLTEEEKRFLDEQ